MRHSSFQKILTIFESTMAASIRVVAINDVYELVNLPRLQTFLSRLSSKPSAVVLSGDFLSPSTLSSVDGGRGMVNTLRATGLTHVSLGNHEQDLRLESLHDRLLELSKSVEIVNSNLRNNLPTSCQWIHSVTSQYSIVNSPCNQVKVAFLGLLTDEPGVFRDNTFKSIPIQDVIDTYTTIYKEIVPNVADCLIPLTHQSIGRDRELAEAMLSLHGGNGVIIGGHEHEPFDELVGDDSNSIRILKSGMDATAASLIDLSFDISTDGQPIAKSVEARLETISDLEPSDVVQKLVDKHMAVIKALDEQFIVDLESTDMLPPGTLLSSERTRYQQTTVGSVFLQMIKEEMEVDAAVLNGATIKGGTTYDTGQMSYAELKKELPFPTKMVVVPMKRWELQDAIDYSRTAIEEGTDLEGEGDIPRRGYLQVDWNYENIGHLGFPDDEMKVALPRNLLNGFCNIKPLIEIGSRLKQEGTFPASDDYVPAIDLVVRHACKNRWFQIISDIDSFDEFDLNDDGVLDRYEIEKMMEHFLGYKPADFVVDDMIAALDEDENGVIDKGEFSFLLARMEREQNWTRNF